MLRDGGTVVPMAVYYLNWSVVSRSKGQSAVAAAAYRHGRKMKAEIGGNTYDYTEKTDITHAEITLPEGAPEWLVEAYGAPALGRLLDGKEATEANRREAVGRISEKLWNDVELFEDAHNIHALRARLAGKAIFALPVELTRDQQIELARSFVKNSLAARGAVVDWVRHDPDPNDAGEANPHIHATVTLRHVGERGWELKNRVWDQYSLTRSLRAEWAREANIALEQAGRPERIDHRKLIDQGIELDPTSYDRTLADALEERGEEFRRKVKAEEALEANRAYLKADPEHILAVVSAERTLFTAQDVTDAFRRQGFEKAAAAVLTGQAMQSFEVIGLTDTMGGVEHLFTTRAQLHVESNLMAEALGMVAAVSVSDVLPKDVVEGLDDGQRVALKEMVSDKRLGLVSGHAGTGKTHVIGLAAQVWKARGYEVLGGAISGRATQNLGGIEGLRAMSLAAWEARWARGDQPEAGKFVFVMDEAGMVGTATWARVQHQVERMGGILRPVGDPEQLQPVLDTGVFGQLMARVGGAVIADVRRMRDAGDREATKLFARGFEGAEAALAHYRDTGAIHEEPTVKSALDALVNAYYAEPGQGVSPANAPGQSQSAFSASVDPIETGAGVIVLPEAAIRSLAALAEKEGEQAGAAARDGQAGRASQQKSGSSRGAQAQRYRGPSTAAVREALLERAEDLFQTVFGEPVHPNAKEWQAREKAAQVMRMQGPKRGLWHDYSAGEGGDLLDLIAREFCGLSEAKSDFPRVMKEAARYVGIATDQPVDETLLKARATERERKAAEAEKQEAARRAALVKTLAGTTVPVEGTPAVAYLAGRGIAALPESEIGWLPPVPEAPVRSPEFGALVVWARDAEGVITGGQRILLNPDGTKAARDVRKPSFGAVGGSHARFAARKDGMSLPLRGGAENGKQLQSTSPANAAQPSALPGLRPSDALTAPQEPPSVHDPATDPLVIAEGPESALSIWQATGYETWAVFGASNWKTVPLPLDRPVILAPDRDAPDSPAGRAFRKAVGHHLAAIEAAQQGGRLSIAVAPEPEGSKHDLNDTLQRAGSEAVRDAIAGARPVVIEGTPSAMAWEKDLAGLPSQGASSGSELPVSSAPLQAEPSRVAICYSRQDVDKANDALRTRAIGTGRVEQGAELHYGEIVRLDRRGLVPKRYTAPMLLAPGDRVIFTRPYREMDISKSSFATVTATRPGQIELDLDDGRAVEIDMTAFDHFDYGYAATAHQLQGVTVDHAFALAHPRMNRPVTYVMMSRHRDSVQMFVPQSRFEDESFEEVACRDDYLTLGWESEQGHPVAGQRFVDSAHGSRPDRLELSEGNARPLSGPNVGFKPNVGFNVSYLRDPHLLGVMRRVAGLLSSDWAKGDPVLGEDDKGYAADPQRVVDDLVARHSVIEANQVASELARAAPHPDTFVRLFREAMTHPDLMALNHDETGPRLYSTGARVELELGALDLGVTLAVAHHDKGLSLDAAYVTEALNRAGLDDTARDAAMHGAQAGQLSFLTSDKDDPIGVPGGEVSQVRLITGGAGSGKTAVLAALADAHERAGLTVHRIAPTRNAGRAFEARTGTSVRSFRSFLHGLETGSVTLDANTVILLDEAGLLEVEETRDLLDVAEMSGARLIAAWDPAQVGRGRLFEDLEARIGSVHLAGTHRQKTRQARETMEQVGTGTARQEAEGLVDAGVVKAVEGRQAALEKLVDGYLADRSPDRIVVAGSRAEAAEVNHAIRAKLYPQSAGAAGANAPPSEDGHVPAGDLHEGDRIVLSAWYAPARLPAGTRGVVVRADTDEVRIRLEPGMGSGGSSEQPSGGDPHVVVRRDDAEFRCGAGFAQTVFEAKGQGHSSVHVLAHRGLTRAALVTAMGLHEKKLRIVVPASEENRVEALSGILSRSRKRGRVATHVLDPALAVEAVADQTARLRHFARGAGSPWVRAELSTAQTALSEADLIADPARILPVLAAKRVRFTIADLRREIAARVSSDTADTDGLVSAAMGSPEIVWLKEKSADGASFFTTRGNENAAYLLAHPEHILTLIGAERTVFTLDELKEAFEKRLPQEDGAVMLEKVSSAEPNVGLNTLVALEAWGPRGAQLFTTRAQITTEQNLVAQAKRMAAREVAWEEPANPVSLSGRITGGQRRAGEAMLDAHGMVLVRGVAGSGKTTVLREAAAIWKARGFEVCGGALSGDATRKLGDGVKEMSVASLAAWEAQWAKGWRPGGEGFVFVMDEAGMVGSDVWARVQDRVARLGGKLIAVGDPAQLQPVSASNAWMAVEAELGCLVIDRARRQVSRAERGWTEGFAAGGTAASDAIRGYERAGCVHFRETITDAITQLAGACYDMGTPDETRIALAYTRADVVRLNAAIREQALARGVVDAATVRSYGTVEEEDGSRALLFGVGDRVVFQQPNQALGIPRNAGGTVIRTDAGRLALRLDEAQGREVGLDRDEAAALDYGYAITIHRSQGLTVDHAFTLAHGYMDRHLLYVAMSRHVQSTQIFVPRERIAGIDDLAVQAQRSQYRSLGQLEVGEPLPARYGAGLSGIEAVARRGDVAGGGEKPPSEAGIPFEADAHLAGILGRVTGLLASEYTAGDPVVGDDPRGYAVAPHKVVDDLIVRRATFEAEDIARELMKVARAPDTISRLFREAMDHPDLISLADGSADGQERVYTTKTHLDLELEVMDRAVKLAFQGHGGGPQPGPRLIDGLVKERGLTEDQAAALRLTASGRRLSIIRGGSGSGKTYLAAALADLHTRQGCAVIGVSPTGRGVDNLRTEGAVRALTLNGLERLVREQKITLDAKTVILLDEAGQIGAQTANGFLEMIEGTGAQLIAFLDTDQPGPLEAAPVFRTLEARIGSVELGLGRRQKDPDLRAAVRGLGDHTQADGAIAQLDAQGVLKPGSGRARSIGKLAEAYVRDRAEDKIVLAHTRRDVADINTAIRKRLDTWFPERLADAPATAEEGSVDALRTGDRIVLTERYSPKDGFKPNAGLKPAWLRPGTEAVVDRRARDHVVLRIGSGEEAGYLKLKTGGEEQGVSYRFAFAGTIAGAKGRGVDSVHMLASPGLTRRLLHTGASLCQSALNIVVPVSKDQVIPAVTAIARREDTPRSALDYGFEASAHAREVIRANRTGDKPAPTALMDGLDRTLGWMADSLDGGVRGVREQAPATRRLDRLRQGVVAELMAAGKSEARQSFTLEDRHMLETRIDSLVLPRGGWKRFLGQGWGQGWAVRSFEAEMESRYIPGVARDDQMVDRVLKRGVAMAEATGEDGMRDWFSRAQGNVAAEIAAQKAAYARSRAEAGHAPAQAAPVPQSQPSSSAPKESAVPVPAQSRDYRGMALQLAQAISARIPRGDPVHDLDQVTLLEEMLRRAEPVVHPGGIAPSKDDEVMKRVPYITPTSPEMGRMGPAAGRALARGPVMERAHLLADRAAVIKHLETPTEPMEPAQDFVPRLKVFTHNEVFALHEPDAPWPDSLPARLELERAVISKRLRKYGDQLQEERKMETEAETEKLRDAVLKKLTLGRIDTQSLDRIVDAFDQKEIAALRNPDLELPGSLPEMDRSVRKMVAETLDHALKSKSEGTGASGADQQAPLPRIEMPPEPDLGPDEARVRDLAMSLGSAVSQHFAQSRLVHEADLEDRIRDLLGTEHGDQLLDKDAEAIARQFAEIRLMNDVYRACVAELAPDMPHMSAADMSNLADQAVYSGVADARFLMGPRADGFEARAEELIDEKLSSDPPVPTEYDRTVAEILSRENSDPELAEILGQALEYGVPGDAASLRAKRMDQINDLAVGKLGQNPQLHVKDLFSAFTHDEVELLLKGEGKLPDTLPEMDALVRERVSRSMLLLFSRIKGPQEAPALKQARQFFRDRARDLGLNIDKGPSRGPEL